MKNAFGATLLFQIVIFFVILFTGYICLSINQTKAFNVKNEIVKAVERHAPNLDGGVVGALIGVSFSADISEIMERQGYRIEGNCDRLDGDYTLRYNRDGLICTDDRCAVCIQQVTSTMAGKDTYYYKVVTFYQLDLPIIKSVFNLTTKGETKIIYKGGA